jgi:hypothetical protein
MLLTLAVRNVENIIPRQSCFLEEAYSHQGSGVTFSGCVGAKHAEGLGKQPPLSVRHRRASPTHLLVFRGLALPIGPLLLGVVGIFTVASHQVSSEIIT